jgi:hypothetical protein
MILFTLFTGYRKSLAPRTSTSIGNLHDKETAAVTSD